jgi:hypothetical protein
MKKREASHDLTNAIKKRMRYIYTRQHMQRYCCSLNQKMVNLRESIKHKYLLDYVIYNMRRVRIEEREQESPGPTFRRFEDLNAQRPP